VGSPDDSDDLRELVERLVERVDAQQRVIERQQAEIEDLRSRLKKDSRNSSRPPSSDAPWSKRRGSRKPASDKPQGGRIRSAT
jgi:transposase